MIVGTTVIRLAMARPKRRFYSNQPVSDPLFSPRRASGWSKGRWRR